MTMPVIRTVAMARLVIVAALLVVPSSALAHGDPEPGNAAMNSEAEIKALSVQPARVLAQQALATLKVRDDAHEAGVRLDAALESKDRSDIDVSRLRQATATLDSGDSAGAIPLLDEALSRPLGADKGKALHEAGREFVPEAGAQEVVGTILGGMLLLLGAFALWRGRDRAAHA